jgi:hypothetical protein
MTENHGVPGSNPGPATVKSPANSGKNYSLGGAAGPLFRGVSTAESRKGLF